MKVWEIRDAWSFDHLQPGDRPEPEPGPFDVVLRMRAASLNSRDLIVPLRGYGRGTGDLPLIPISDGVGEVVAVGDRVTRVKVGDRAMPAYFAGWIGGAPSAARFATALGGPIDGVMAEHRCQHEDQVVKAPIHLSDAEAATLPCAGLTAWSAIVTHGGLKPGDRVLIQGSGGVALFALTFAKLMGAEVTMISSSDAKLERLKALGADHGINYRTEADWAKASRPFTDGAGYDLILELGGQETLPLSLKAAAFGGTIQQVGVLSGLEMQASLGMIVTRQIRLQGITVGHRDGLEAMCRAMEQHRLSPVIDRHFGFDDLKEALEALKAGGHFGKLVVDF